MPLPTLPRDLSVQVLRAICRLVPLLEWGQRLLPHYLKANPSRFHRELCADLDHLRQRRGSRLARIAPRGSAKSTWSTLALPLRCALEGTEPYTLILSDTSPQADEFVNQIRAELETNLQIAAAYPESAGRGPEWCAGRLRLRNGCLIEALSKGQRIRGRRNREARPTLVVIDDPQGNRDVTSATERARAWDWLTREVIPAGTDGYTSFVSLGTALHREAIAVRLLTAPGWEGRTYRSIERWPDNLQWWLEWERTLTNLADPDRDHHAALFYESHRAQADQGAEVLWPEWKPLYALMHRRAEIGASAFDAEDQGNPYSATGSEWPAEYFDWPGFWFDQWPTDMLYRVQSLDPSKGAGEESDYQAHAMLGVTRDGAIWVDCDLRRENPTEMIARAIRLAKDFGPVDSIVLEDNATMGLLQVEMARQCREAGVLLPWECLTQTQDKRPRILRADPYLSRKQIRVRNTPGGRLLVNQWRDTPFAEHDDAADAVGTALRRLELLTIGQ